MEFNVKNTLIEKQHSACVVVGIYDKNQLTPSAKQLDTRSNGYLTMILKRGDMTEKIGESLMLHDVPGSSCPRVLLIHCGDKKAKPDAQYRKLMAGMTHALKKNNIKEAYSYLVEVKSENNDTRWKIRQLVEISGNMLYTFDQFKSKADKKGTSLKRINIHVPDRADAKSAKQAILEGQAIVNGMSLAKDLGNMPANTATPTYLAKTAASLAKQHKNLTVKALNEAEMKKLGMGALLSVSQGSREPAKLIIINYKGANKSDKPVVLVGKGVTFDSGGISIKPSAAMDEMKYDMCGAASVFGALSIAAELQLPLNVIGVVPASENLPDGNASKPGDIVTSMSGQTIEILNTDAEGRLVLCDALTYSKRFKPAIVIDIATLTGACVVALGKHASAVLSNDDKLVKSLQTAGIKSGDRVWEMPLWDEYQSQINSNFADMGNVGGRDAGTITAACFLSRFTKDFTWAHLDIAGTAWKSGGHKGATGRPVPLLAQYLFDRIPSK